jgi:phage terminase small subunit
VFVLSEELRNAEDGHMMWVSDPGRLHPRHERFVAEFVLDCNATAAYRRTGYRARGHAAEVNASRLRRRPDVKRAIVERVKRLLATVNAAAAD